MSERIATAQKVTPSMATRASSGLLQRKCDCGNSTTAGGECAECGMKKLQRKLSIGATDDPLELEADRVADRVMAAPTQPNLNRTPLRIQRFSGDPSGRMGAVSGSVDQVLASPGQPLEPTLRRDMEQRFGHDFSQVRVHTDSMAVQSAQEVNAKAYTVGRSIAFGAGQYAPHTTPGRRLLAHELAHFVQQDMAANGEGGPSLKLYRTPTSTPPKARPVFVPTVQLDPESPSMIKVGDHLIQTFKIANRSRAPRGTVLHWDGGLYHDMDAYNVELLGTQSENDRFLIWVQARAPGKTRLRCMVWHESPAGDRSWTHFPDAVVSMPDVTVSSVGAIREDALHKQSSVLDPLFVGDLVALRFHYANLSATRSDFPVSLDITGPGRDMLVVAKGPKMVAPGVAEVTYKVVKNGPLDVSTQLGPFGVPSDQIKPHRLEATVKYVQYGYTDTNKLEALFADIVGDYKYILLQQRDGVEKVEKAANANPPKEPRSFWSFAAELALTAACFAVGKVVEQYVVERLELMQLGEKVSEVVGEGLKEATADGIREKIKGEADAVTSENGRDIFFEAQKETLTKQAREAEQSFNHVGKQLLLNSKDPLKQAQALKEGQAKAFEQAKTETENLELDRWASNQARSELGTGSVRAAAKLGRRPELATNLRPVLSAEGVGTTIDEEEFGVTKEKGVLTIKVEARNWTQPVKIESMMIRDWPQEMRNLMKGRRIKDLKLPVVVLARGLPNLTNEGGGLKIGRDELGNIMLGSHRVNAGAWLSLRAIAVGLVKPDYSNHALDADYTDANAKIGAKVVFDNDLAQEPLENLEG